MNFKNSHPDLVYQEYQIDQQPWPEYQTTIKASAKTAYDGNNLFLELPEYFGLLSFN